MNEDIITKEKLDFIRLRLRRGWVKVLVLLAATNEIAEMDSESANTLSDERG